MYLTPWSFIYEGRVEKALHSAFSYSGCETLLWLPKLAYLKFKLHAYAKYIKYDWD